MRARAAQVIARVFRDGRSLTAALEPALESIDSASDRALLQELCFGTLREWFWIDWVLAALLDKPLRRQDADVHALLAAGVYQLYGMRTPAHAAVHETVAAADALGKSWAKGLVNAVLRRYQREADALAQRAQRHPQAHWRHPAWFIEAVQHAWPDHWQAILAAGNTPPPMWLRIHAQRCAIEEARARLESAGLDVTSHPHAPHALRIEPPRPVGELPGFREGWCSVQDAGAQLAAPLLQLAPGQRVLDACAAPGGKTAHLLESEPGLDEVVAVDTAPERTARIEQNLERLGLAARVVTADAGAPEQWWDGVAFDRILLDVPCTATGVIRRHPDIKILRRPEDAERLAERQFALLAAVWPLLRRGGMLLYATCSVLPGENEAVVRRFLARQADAEARPIDAAWGQPREVGRQILPGEAGMDGFYYAVLAKR